MLGLTASSPDMQDTLERYLDNTNMYDINIISTMGLNDEDITAIEQVEGIEKAYGIQTKDTEAKLGEVEKNIKVIEYNEINNETSAIKKVEYLPAVSIPYLSSSSVTTNAYNNLSYFSGLKNTTKII